MKMTLHISLERETRELVLAVHCSGGSPRQWDTLAGLLDPQEFLVEAPQLQSFVPQSDQPARPPHSLAIETAPLITRLRAHGRPAHLVGHSYGGAVVLHVAAHHPELVSRLTLYEPAAFHLLRELGADGRRALLELQLLGHRVEWASRVTETEEAARLFVSYWGGSEAWKKMSNRARQAICAYLPKGRREFEAMLGEETGLDQYRHFDVPVLFLHGSAGSNPAKMVGKTLAREIPNVREVEIAGAGHMGPITHSGKVASVIAEHVASVNRVLRPEAVSVPLAAEVVR
jgi:pimeloyl-ACP methyl ester carboxylesterase